MTIWKSANNQAYFDCDIMPVNSQVPINFYALYGSNIGNWATACYNCASWEMSIYTSSISYSVLFIWDSMPNTFTQNGTDARSYIKHDTDTDKYVVYMGGGYGYTASEPVSDFPNWRIAYPEQNIPQAFKDYVSTPLITYTWSSVPAISGKNGILSLTQILNINDGEPVENITNKGNLDFSKKTKVNTLVNSVYEPTYKEDATKATVEYEIPEAEYQYTKLVYKKKKIPKSASDGTAIDIGADDTEAFVSGLEENTTYYFVVFTNRTKSNAYKFKTGKNEAPEGIFKIRITTSQGVKDSDFKENIEVTRV